MNNCHGKGRLVWCLLLEKWQLEKSENRKGNIFMLCNKGRSSKAKCMRLNFDKAEKGCFKARRSIVIKRAGGDMTRTKL